MSSDMAPNSDLVELDIPLEHMEFIRADKPLVSRTLVDRSLVFEQSAYRQSLTAPRSTIPYFDFRLHHMMSPGSDCLLRNCDPQHLPTPDRLKRAGWFRVGSRGGKQVFSTFAFDTITNVSETLATSLVLQKSPWGLDGNLVRPDDPSMSFAPVENLELVQYLPEFEDPSKRGYDALIYTWLKIVNHAHLLWTDLRETEIVPCVVANYS
ncbi:hypothetical protein KCU77_g443, partial [Aureobasidium melanogenum]